jgi:Domain of unknown function (DUF4978)
MTRANAINTVSIVSDRIAINNALRAGPGTNLDFIGIDNYSNSPATIESIMPIVTNNFPEVMENGGTNPASVRLAALAGNTVLGTYDMCGPWSLTHLSLLRHSRAVPQCFLN